MVFPRPIQMLRPIPVICVLALVVLPLICVAWFALFPAENIWPHLLATVLPRYVENTLVLMITVGAGSAALGTVLAYLVTHLAFPGRRFVEFALFLPLAMPSYIAAFALVDFLEYAGPVQTGLRTIMGFETARDYWFPDIRTRGGAACVMILTLYPYVYLLARTSFRAQSSDMAHIAATLGLGPWGRFLRISLPTARPGIIAGTMIVMMETINDFGTVDYFAIQTLTTGIFSTWLESYNIGGAAQISLVLLGLIILLTALERINRRKASFSRNARHTRMVSPRPIRRVGAWVALLFCVLPIALGFVLPIAILILGSGLSWPAGAGQALWHSVQLGVITAVLTVGVAAIFVTIARTYGKALSRAILIVGTLGYAVPGAVLAIGVLIPVSGMDHWIADHVLAITGWDPGLILTGGMTILVVAYFIRFFAIGVGSVDAGAASISDQLTHVSATLGQGPISNFRKVTWPLLRGAVATALILVFVDTIKELPATLLLRPFNFETLATHTFLQAKLENLPGASPTALMIVAVASVAVILFAKAAK